MWILTCCLGLPNGKIMLISPVPAIEMRAYLGPEEYSHEAGVGEGCPVRTALQRPKELETCFFNHQKTWLLQAKLNQLLKSWREVKRGNKQINTGLSVLFPMLRGMAFLMTKQKCCICFVLAPIPRTVCDLEQLLNIWIFPQGSSASEWTSTPATLSELFSHGAVKTFSPLLSQFLIKIILLD